VAVGGASAGWLAAGGAAWGRRTWSVGGRRKRS
jgi:hypothetical protein